MQRAVQGPGRGSVRRPAGSRRIGRGVPRRAPGRAPGRRPAQQRALRPFDGRTAVFVAGSPSLHRFIASRLSGRDDIWIAKPLSARDYAKGTVFRMKPDVTIVDLDPIWNPTGLPLARAVSEACPAAHVVLVAPEGYVQGPMIATASQKSGWSAVLRRKGDTGERLTKAIVAGLGGGSWVDPELGGTDEIGAGDSGNGTVTVAWNESATDGQTQVNPDGSTATGKVVNADVEDWKRRARQGMS